MASDGVAGVRAAVVDMRRGRGWSQSELARRAGVAQGQISRFEAGLSPGVGLAWVQRLLEAMGRELVPAPRVERAVVSAEALDVDPRGLTEEELVARFPGADGFADRGFLTAALLWLRDGIVAGREPAIQGNQRTIWYRYFKPVMSGVVGRNAADGPTMVSRAMGLLVELRHSSATEHVRLGTALPVIQEMLGHAKIDTTRRYAHVRDDQLRAAAAGLGERFREAARQRAERYQTTSAGA